MNDHSTAIITLPPTHRPRLGVPRGVVDLAVVLPAGAETVQVSGLAEALAAARAAGADVTVIAARPQAQAEAVALGLRVATSVAEWQRWLTDTRIRQARDDRRRNAGTHLPWSVVRPGLAPTDSLPGFVLDLSGHGEPPADLMPADERYELQIADRIRATGGYDADRSTLRHG